MNEDKTTNNKDEIKVVDEMPRSLSFPERMRGLLPHRSPLKDRMRYKKVSYIDLLRLGPLPSRKYEKTLKELAKQK